MRHCSYKNVTIKNVACEHKLSFAHYYRRALSIRTIILCSYIICLNTFNISIALLYIYSREDEEQDNHSRVGGHQIILRMTSLPKLDKGWQISEGVGREVEGGEWELGGDWEGNESWQGEST